MPENLSALSGRKGLDKNLFEQIVENARESGTPDPEYLKNLAEEFLMGKAITHGTTSFYDFIKPDHQGVKVHVCNGSACLMAGTQNEVRNKLHDHFDQSEIGHMCCLGRCYENSAFNYNGVNYSAGDIGNLDEIIEGAESASTRYNVLTKSEPVLTGTPLDTASYKNLVQKMFAMGTRVFLQEIKNSNIRGRGGAGFPMGIKFEACKKEISDKKYIVCNADEGDPGAFSDRYLLEEQPFSVLFGIMAAGYIVGADRGVLYIRGEYPESIKTIREAINKLEKSGLHGTNIMNSGFNFRFKIIEGAGAYVCGEETALLSSIEGQRPEVRIRPPFPAQKGLFNKPTIVNNVETLAAIPYILANGGKTYAALGTAKSTGTKLVSLDSFFNQPGIVEIEMGISFKELVYDLGKGFSKPVKALHVGGPLGGIVPVTEIDKLTLDFESFKQNGFLLGHAGIVSIPEEYPMISYLEHLFDFTAVESCGKCYPCSIGAVRGREMMQNAIDGKSKLNRQLLEDLLETMEDGSLCALGGGLPLGVRNAEQYFEEELNEYFK